VTSIQAPLGSQSNVFMDVSKAVDFPVTSTTAEKLVTKGGTLRFCNSYNPEKW